LIRSFGTAASVEPRRPGGKHFLAARGEWQLSFNSAVVTRIGVTRRCTGASVQGDRPPATRGNPRDFAGLAGRRSLARGLLKGALPERDVHVEARRFRSTEDRDMGLARDEPFERSQAQCGERIQC